MLIPIWYCLALLLCPASAGAPHAYADLSITLNLRLNGLEENNPYLRDVNNRFVPQLDLRRIRGFVAAETGLPILNESDSGSLTDWIQLE